MTPRHFRRALPALAALLYPLLAFAQPAQAPQHSPYYWHHMWNGGWGNGWFGPLFLVVFVMLCFAVFFMIVHRMGGWPQQGGQPLRPRERPSVPGAGDRDSTTSALRILNERFAKGEIQKPEYDEKKAAILSGGAR